jgi:hypothetical protein
MEDFNEETRNIYVIKRRLAERRKQPFETHFTYYVRDFVVKIFTSRHKDYVDFGPDDSIVHHQVLDVNLYEEKRDTKGVKTESPINLERDSRFKGYAPIKYTAYPGYSNGQEMPLINLCELIKYLHRLSELAIFT